MCVNTKCYLQDVGLNTLAVLKYKPSKVTTWTHTKGCSSIKTKLNTEKWTQSAVQNKAIIEYVDSYKIKLDIIESCHED